jgi:hypothetical protein
MSKAGASLSLWRALLDVDDELFEAEFNKECVDNYLSKSSLPPNTKILVGDQANDAVLRDWKQQMNLGSSLVDIIIDDGGHCNRQIFNSFQALFDEALAPGGIYFIEDLHTTGTNHIYQKRNCEAGETLIIIDVLKDWMTQLLQMNELSMPIKYKIPHRIKSISCQAEACAIVKCETEDLARCS